MAFKMKGTAMYDKMMVDGKSSMQLKKEFGGPMEHKVVAADGPGGDPHAHVNARSNTGLPMKSPMDGNKFSGEMAKNLENGMSKDDAAKAAAAAMPMKTPMELEKEDSHRGLLQPVTSFGSQA